MKKIFAVCLLSASVGCTDAPKVESLVYEANCGSVCCLMCSDDHNGDVYHPIKKITARRKGGIVDVWVVSMRFDCPRRGGGLTGEVEYSYREGKVKCIRQVSIGH